MIEATPTARRLAIVVVLAAILGSLTSHLVARWVGIPKPVMAYRRIGPTTGPMVFVAGSSLVQFGLSWPEISEHLGQGIENWGVGGSTPEIWEISQVLATNVNFSIIGASVYDLNEHRLCDSRADFVPVKQTVRDLVSSAADWPTAKRLMSQYPLTFARVLFPTAARSEAVLQGFRRMVRARFGLASSREDQAAALVLPSEAVLSFGESSLQLSALSEARVLRRLAALRSEIQGQHSFSGTKSLALRRVLSRAHQQGQVLVVILPVSPAYAAEFLTPAVQAEFEAALRKAVAAAPGAQIIRLDWLSALQSNEYFSDLVHLNSAGRRIATEAVLREMNHTLALP